MLAHSNSLSGQVAWQVEKKIATEGAATNSQQGLWKIEIDNLFVISTLITSYKTLQTNKQTNKKTNIANEHRPDQTTCCPVGVRGGGTCLRCLDSQS